MAPAAGGGLYVMIPARTAPALLALLDSAGRPRPGWPIQLAGTTSCGQLLAVDDGSVRVLCGLDNPYGSPHAPTQAFAFNSSGRSLAGWPMDPRPSSAAEGSDWSAIGRVVGDELRVFNGVVDTATENAIFAATLATVAGDGVLTAGTQVPMGSCCVHVFGIGPDGAGYDVQPGAASFEGPDEPSLISALDASGLRAGWPVSIDGVASAPAFGPGGRIVLSVGSTPRQSTRILIFDRDGQAASARSPELPIATVDKNAGDTGGCPVGMPEAPVVAKDGTIFVYSEIESAIQALDPSLGTMTGWPFETATPLVRARPGLESEHEAGYCPASVVPATGPDATLYLSLEARNTAVGGSIVAVGPNGRARAGWPVELKRAGGEFWSVVVGSDGTVYALAVEPEAGGSSSASILAIAPDSTVLYATTIVEP
jgi:outer membrane protein assembly factor BamB